MDITCEFCCKPLKDAGSFGIDYTFRMQLISMLDYLNVNSATLHGDYSTCQECSEKITSTHTFKKNCAELEKDLPVLDSHSTKVDLRKLLQDEGKLEQNMEDEIQICRLCWSILDFEAVLPLTELLEKENMRTVFRKHIPEVNLQAVENPVICMICLNYLNNLKGLLVLSEFVREEDTNLSPEEIAIPNITEDDNCIVHVFGGKVLEEESDMNSYIKTERDHNVFDETEAIVKIEPTEIKCQPQCIVEPVQLKHEEIHIKSEEMEVERVTAESTDWRHNEENEKRKEMKLHERADSSSEPKPAGNRECELSSVAKARSEVDLYKCQKCSFATKHAGSLEVHMLVHGAGSEANLYKCRECSYATKRAFDLKRHMLVHKTKSEVDLYKCRECSYAAKRADCLKKHMLLHKPKSEVRLYKCQECSYVTKHAGSLQEHMLVHLAGLKASLYKCHECSYATKPVGYLKSHMSVNDAKSEVDLYKCQKCSFAPKYVIYLKKHSVHVAGSEANLSKCHECSYTTKRAFDLKRHMLVHKTKSEVDLHRCQKCSFATKHAGNLKTHMLIHAAKSEVYLYKCQKCSFATKHACNLKKHTLVHKGK